MALFLVLWLGVVPPKVVLRIGTPSIVQSANILLDNTLSMLAYISNPPLMKMDASGKPVGQLVEDFEVSKDLKIWTFSLLENLFWSDGKKLTSSDIQFSIEYTSHKYPPARWMKEMISRIDTPDDHTVVIQLKKPYARLDFELTTYKILPKHIWEKIENPRHYSNPGPNIGCGPFVIEKIDMNRRVVLLTQNSFWKGKNPKIHAIEIHVFQNRDTLSLALAKGSMDIYYEYASPLPYFHLKRIQALPHIAVMEQLNLGLVFLGFNLRKSPMSDINFRRAVASAINYNEIVKIELLGNGIPPSQGFISPNMAHYKKTPALEYDPQKAVQILRNAGYSDSNKNGIIENPENGKDVSLVLLCTSLYVRLSELVRDYLESSGIKIHIKTVDGNSWVNFKDNYRYDLIIGKTTPWGMFMHANWATGYFDSRRTGEGVLHTVDDPVFHNLCDSILAEKDDAHLKVLAYRVQEYYTTHLPAVALYWNTMIIPYKKDFSGWLLDPLYNFYNIDSILNIAKKWP